MQQGQGYNLCVYKWWKDNNCNKLRHMSKDNLKHRDNAVVQVLNVISAKRITALTISLTTIGQPVNCFKSCWLKLTPCLFLQSIKWNSLVNFQWLSMLVSLSWISHIYTSLTTGTILVVTVFTVKPRSRNNKRDEFIKNYGFYIPTHWML